MTYIISTIVCILIIALFYNSIKNNRNTHYTITLIISILVIVFNRLKIENSIINNVLIIFNKGFISLSLFTIYMYIGAFRKDSRIRKMLLPIKTQLSVIASVYAILHVFTFHEVFIFDLLHINLKTFASTITPLLLFIIFILLFVTSLKGFKNKVELKKLKDIQSLVYIFFILTYIHLIIVKSTYINSGKKFAILDIIVYSIIFFLYFTLKLNSKRDGKKIKYYILYQLLIALFFIIIPLVSITGALQLNTIEDSEGVDNSTEINQEVNNKQIANPSLNSTEMTKDRDTHSTNSEDNKADNKLNTSKNIDDTTVSQNDNNKEGDKSVDNSLNATGETVELDSNSENNKTSQTSENSTLTEKKNIYKDGMYIDMAKGYKDYIALVVTIEDDEIIDIEVDYSFEDPVPFNKAFTVIKDQILETQSTEVDAISKATSLSKGIIKAVDQALEQARIK